jgi:hypothetical protein
MIWIILLISLMPGCRKFIEVPLPGTEIFPKDVYDSDITATSAVTSIYGHMIFNNGLASGNTQSITFLCALSADELENYSSGTIPREFYENSINVNNTAIETAFWDEAYKYIFEANAVLEGLDNSVGVSTATKVRLQGEALFIRAFCHFQLVNLFGDVPYLTTTDYQTNIVKPRTSRSLVYQQVVEDLLAAQSKLDTQYVTVERVRPNKWAATALLARVYLYTGNWTAAEAQATAVINQSGVYSLDSLNGVFVKNSREAIWQLMPNNTEGFNTWEGKNLILNTAPSIGESNSTVLTRHLLEAFEVGDRRRTIWVDSVATDNGSTVYYFPYKYKVQNGTALKEYSMVLRLAEQHLIRAEARARLGNINGAKEDLNVIRQRAELPSTTANSSITLLTAVSHERQVELFTEWGHRWLDLKRTGKANAILSIVKTSRWQATDTLYPIPQNERSQNPNLTQNPGYN